MKKGMIFIDGGNLAHDWYVAKTGAQIDIERYIDVVKSKFWDTDFVRTYYFTSATPYNKAFLYNVNRLPYCEVITGRLQEKKIKLDRFDLPCPSCGNAVRGEITTQVDKGSDVNMAVEMLRHGFNGTYDTAVLVSRDADFAGVVKILKNLGKNVELVVLDTSKNYAQELTDCVDNVVVLDAEDCARCTLPSSAAVNTSAAGEDMF